MMLLPAHLHRWHSAAWVAGVTLVVSTMLPQPASAAAGQEVRLTGEVIVTQVDPLPGSPEVPESISLRTPDREIATTGLTAALAGKTVTVTGQLRAGILAVTNIESVRPTGSTNGLGIAGVTTYRPRTIRTAYVLTRFASDPAPDYTLADARSRLFGATNSVAAYFREATDGGIVLTGDVLGWYTVTTTDTCDWQTWTAQAQAAAIAAGVNMSQYQEIVTAGPFRLSCPFAGIGNVGTSGAYINGGPSLVVVAHEMGHNFGLHHASTLRCTKNGVTVVLSDACTRAEYGDPYSAMGSSGRLFPARQAY
ncbi:MAG: M12 family metallo-peptidase [Acidimicrobiia bacterium]